MEDQQLQHTNPHVNCPLCDSERIKPTASRHLTFSEGAEIWFKAHRQYLKPNTIRGYECDLKALSSFFGTTPLGHIHIGYIRRYQQERCRKAGPFRINGEMRVLQMVLREADCWERLRKKYKPFPVPKGGAGHSLAPKEEQHLRRVSFGKKKWQLAAHCMAVMLSTTMGFGELSRVRRRDVDLQRGCVTVRDGAKNDPRARTIPLNRSAYRSMCWILRRWQKLGGDQDDQYILPHRPRIIGGSWLLDEPMTAIRSAFRSIRKTAGLSHFRVYDCRVQAITKLLSNPAVSPQVSKEIAGHISQAMQDRYSIQQFETKKAAVQTLDDPDPLQPKPVEKINKKTLDTFYSTGYNRNHA